MQTPLVSVIVPVYNVEKYLAECLDSIVGQTLKNIEIICVNDGSTDSSPEIMREYAVKDPRIKICDKPNGGYGSAMNVGLRNVTGKYIGIVEPDDFIKLEMYETLYNLAEQHGVDIVKSNFFNYFDIEEEGKKEESKDAVDIDGKEKAKKKKIHYDKNGWFSRRRPYPKEPFKINGCPYFLYFHPSIWSCIYRTEFIKKNNIDFQEIKGAGWADNLFQVKTLFLADKIYYTDEAYYFYRRRNWDDAKDLKDFTIPFDRSHEIRQWISEHKIKDSESIACLTKRELAYIGIVFRGNDEKRLSEIKPYLDRYVADIHDLFILKNNREISTSFERKFLSKITEGIFESYKWYHKEMAPSRWKHYKELRKKIFSIHLSGEKSIVLFGIKII